MKESKSRIYRSRLNKLSQENELISGIYNYCDRWCERCSMSKHCGLYQMEAHEGLIGKKNDSERMSEILALAMEMVQEIADEVGVDMNEIPDMDVAEHIPGEVELLAMDYEKEIKRWLVSNLDLFEDLAKQLMLVDENKAESFNDDLELVQFYSSLIGAKIYRAMASSPFEEEEEDLQDQQGSAKIALLCINRSIEAMEHILNLLPEKESDALNFLSVLSKLKRQMLINFPQAMEFKRPGFDD